MRPKYLRFGLGVGQNGGEVICKGSGSTRVRRRIVAQDLRRYGIEAVGWNCVNASERSSVFCSE